MVLQSLHGLPGPQITTAFCDASDTTTVREPFVSGREEDFARNAAPPAGGDPEGDAAHAITAMHAIAKEAGRSNRASIGRNEL